MKAWLIERYGGPEELRLGELPRPAVGPGDVLVEIRAASVNPVDFKIRDGELRTLIRYDFPLILGNDLSGVVAEIGEAVSSFQVGDEVYARVTKERMGTFAEYASVDVSCLAPKPRNLSHAEAASLPLTALTAWQALVDVGKLRRGERVLVQAGAGGVGSCAIQLAKHLGAEVATTASEPKHDLVRELGADQVIDYRSKDFALEVEGCDLVLDTLGGEAQEKAYRVLRSGGLQVSIVGPPEPVFAESWGLGLVLRFGIRLMSFKTRRLARRHGVRYRFLFMYASGEQLAELGKLVEAEVLKPVIDRVYPFERTPEAVAHVEAGGATGKVVISIAD